MFNNVRRCLANLLCIKNPHYKMDLAECYGTSEEKIFETSFKQNFSMSEKVGKTDFKVKGK